MIPQGVDAGSKNTALMAVFPFLQLGSAINFVNRIGELRLFPKE